ncbi:MAG: RHS repeat domain-containing protein, partial [Flammeovirgaceae bacterium]
PIDVFFDDFKVTQNMSDIVAGADYYPFGLPIAERELTREPYRFGYQGQYSEKDRETGFNFFDLRMYDARIGRWVVPDPYGQYASGYVGMGNMPNMGTDPDGGYSWFGHLWRKVFIGGPYTSANGYLGRFAGTAMNLGKLEAFLPGIMNGIFQEVARTRLERALDFAREGLGRFGAARAEREFVRDNFHKTDEYDLSKDYQRHPHDVSEDGDGFSGFTEEGLIDTRDYIGEQDLFGSIVDSETGVTLNVNYYGGWGGGTDGVRFGYIADGSGGNNSFIEGFGFEFNGGFATRISFTFKNKAHRARFFDYYYKNSSNRKKGEMGKKYRKVKFKITAPKFKKVPKAKHVKMKKVKINIYNK